MEIGSQYNFLSTELWVKVVSRVHRGAGWKFGGHSTDSDSVKFWYMDLNDDPLFTETIFNQICEQTKESWILDTVYANGQTHGLSGGMHKDVTDAEPGQYFTCLLYANPEWETTWGGYTVFADDEKGTVVSRYPTPNSIAFFDSTISHCGLEPTRHCTDLRVTVAWKMHKA